MSKSYKNIRLESSDDGFFLTGDVVDISFSTHIKDGKTVKSRYLKVVKSFTIKLKEIDKKEIAKFKNKNFPFFLLKLRNEKFWIARIPKNMSFYSATIFQGRHQCLPKNEKKERHSMCQYLSPSKQDTFGCPKVRNSSLGIENFNFIVAGFETCNTAHDIFFVASCQKYRESDGSTVPFGENIAQKTSATARLL